MEQPGTIQAYEETQLFARVPGYVRLLHDMRAGSSTTSATGSAGRNTIPRARKSSSPAKSWRSWWFRSWNSDRAEEGDGPAGGGRGGTAEKAVAAAEANIATMEAAVVEATALKVRWESESKRIAGLVQDRDHRRPGPRRDPEPVQGGGRSRALGRSRGPEGKADRDKAEADVRSMQARVDVAKADALARRPCWATPRSAPLRRHRDLAKGEHRRLRAAGRRPGRLAVQGGPPRPGSRSSSPSPRRTRNS